MIDLLLKSLNATSHRLSILGQTELAQHQECAMQALGFAKIDGVDCEIFSAQELQLHGVPVPLASDQIIKSFATTDVKLAAQEDRERVVLLFSVASAEMFDGVPMFWQNYLSAEFLPAMFIVCIEKHELLPGQFEYLALPYFSIIKLSGNNPEPLIGFVGQNLRERAVKEREASQSEAMSNIGLFLGLATMLLKTEQP